MVLNYTKHMKSNKKKLILEQKGALCNIHDPFFKLNLIEKKLQAYWLQVCLIN